MEKSYTFPIYLGCEGKEWFMPGLHEPYMVDILNQLIPHQNLRICMPYKTKDDNYLGEITITFKMVKERTLGPIEEVTV